LEFELQLRKTTKSSLSQKRPLVGIAVDGITGFGRAVMRGAMRYGNARRGWLFHEELRFSANLRRGWPRCDGAIAGGASRQALEYIRSRSRHIVHCSGNGDPSLNPVVCLDDVAAGEVAARHLIDCRLENFAYYGRHLQPMSGKRLQGFRAALERHAFTCRLSPVDWPEESEGTANQHWPKLIAWLRALPKPVGVFAIDDSAAHDLAGACLRGKIPVPDRIAIVGVNNDDLLCESAFPSLSSVEADYSRVGHAAAALLDRMLQGERIPSGDRLVQLPPLGVVHRLSTDILAVENPDLSNAIRFIRDHACDPCSVGDVLQKVPVARRWLEKEFVRQLDRTPHDEIIRVRMEAATRLLIQANLPIEDIALKCGFSAVSNFGRAFVSALGTTPAAYRRSAIRKFY
jgi:LacI family transcriptional regulator